MQYLVSVSVGKIIKYLVAKKSASNPLNGGIKAGELVIISGDLRYWTKDRACATLFDNLVDAQCELDGLLDAGAGRTEDGSLIPDIMRIYGLELNTNKGYRKGWLEIESISPDGTVSSVETHPYAGVSQLTGLMHDVMRLRATNYSQHI